MATQVIRKIEWVRNIHGMSEPEVFYDPNVKEANSQTFIEGDLVYLNSGAITIWADSATTLLGGVAIEPATNVTSGNKALKFYRIRSGDVWRVNMDGATAVADIGNCTYGMEKYAAGYWIVDKSGSTTDRVIIIDFVYGPDINTSGAPYIKAMGDTNGQVDIVFVQTNAAAAGANTLQFGS